MKAQRKALARLHSRTKEHDTAKRSQGTTRPGSMNPRKGTGERAKFGRGVAVTRSRAATPRTSSRPGGGATKRRAA